MDDYKYTDLKITNDEIELDAAGYPVLVHDRDVIVQDLIHAVKESALLETLIGERSKDRIKLVIKKVRMLIEKDERIFPGSSVISKDQASGRYLIQADSDFGHIQLGSY